VQTKTRNVAKLRIVEVRINQVLLWAVVQIVVLFTGDLIAHVTLRLQAPCCDLDPCWEDEELSVAVTRTIMTLHKTTVRPRRASTDAPRTCLTAPAFCYVFPLIRFALLSTFAKADDSLVTAGLQIISEHVQMRGSPDNAREKDLCHPNLLPRRQMFELLIEMISEFISVCKFCHCMCIHVTSCCNKVLKVTAFYLL
jgi:hypothetical protein